MVKERRETDEPLVPDEVLGIEITVLASELHMVLSGNTPTALIVRHPAPHS